jgi:arylsulfatase A-like enzyme
MKKTALVVGLVAVVLGVARFAPSSQATTASPRLVVVVSVDQMRADYLTRFGALYKAGLKELNDRGASFTNARYRHANCETGPGHSVILSGRNAHHSGIIANAWYDTALGRAVNVVDDPAVVPVGGSGRGASPAHFIGFTLGDMLKKTRPAARVVGVSLKDRAAIMMAGPRADGAYWYESAEGRFITSSYYTKAAPAWLDAFNARRLPDAYGAKPWTKLLGDESVYRRYAGEDRVATEADLEDTVFPHAIAAAPGTQAFYERFRRTPFADELTFEAALAAMEGHSLGTDDVTDILAIGFSASDYIGHAFGPDSHEIMDQMLRLDLLLGRLLEALRARVGADRFVLVLTSDHSVMPLAETLQKQGVKAGRVKPSDLQTAAMAALEKRFPGKKDLVASYMAPDFYLNLDALERQGVRREDVERTLAEALLATGTVEKVYTASSFAGDPPPPSVDPYFDAVRRSYFASRSPHVIGRLKEYLYLTSSPGGTGHGSSYEYDRHVPVMFLGANVKAGTYVAEAAPEDIAPTLGLILGIDYPLQDARRRLTEMIQAQ